MVLRNSGHTQIVLHANDFAHMICACEMCCMLLYHFHCKIIDFTVEAVKVRLRSIRHYYSRTYRNVIKYVVKHGKNNVNISKYVQSYCHIYVNLILNVSSMVMILQLVNKYFKLNFTWYRVELKRLTDLDFFHTHIHFYDEMGKKVFQNDEEYLKWLETVPTLDGEC